METILGTLADVEASVARAVSMPKSGTFIAQLLYETDLFVQFTCVGESARFDFPLVTPRQQKYETSIRQAASDLQLPLNKDGNDLQVPFDAPTKDIARVTREFLTRVYNVTPATPIEIKSF